MGTKVVNVVNGDYKIVTKSNGEIWLDTGVLQGTVYVTGNLTVKGTTTQVESTVVTINDNTIFLNFGEPGTLNGQGISSTLGGQGGISISRGAAGGNWLSGDAQFLFDENVLSSTGQVTNKYGTFTLTTTTGSLVGLQTSSVRTTGNNNLFLLHSGSQGWVTVAQSNNYERHVFNYTNYDLGVGPITLTSDTNAIPNTQSIYDYVNSAFLWFSQNHIAENDTSIYTYDTDGGHAPSRILFTVDGIQQGSFNYDGLTAATLTVDSVRIDDNTISTNVSNANLVLDPNGTGTIQVEGILQIVEQAVDPTSTASYSKIYPKAPGTGTGTPGKSGIYFVNSLTTDELVAKNRALLFSVLF